jgi:Copper binding periplasmic protein CusF
MPVWQVALVLNLAIAVSLGVAYAGWGRRAEAVDRELETVRAQMEQLERQQQACAGGARAGEQQWSGRGIVRAIYPQLLVITHEEIQGLLPARTTGFRVASPVLRESLRIGDPVRFALRGTVLDDATVVAMERW